MFLKSLSFRLQSHQLGPPGTAIVCQDSHGGVAERLKAPVLKTGSGLSRSWVRIPPPPPGFALDDRGMQGPEPMPPNQKIFRSSIHIRWAHRHGFVRGGVTGVHRARPLRYPKRTINVGLGQLV
jgi:hypothetical protein